MERCSFCIYKGEYILKFNRFENVSGTYIEEISGQTQIGYSMSDTTDFYDMIEWTKNGEYPGSVLSFYEYGSGKIYKPFQKQKNVLYGKPVYLKNYFWFLQGDYNTGKITLFRYLPNEMPEMITQLDISEVNPYNLCIIGEDINIISDDDELICYYPKKFRFSKGSNEGVSLIGDGKVYLSAWIEEGWDDKNDCAGENYKYYEKIIVRDFDGNILSDEIGCLQKRHDGIWWIA